MLSYPYMYIARAVGCWLGFPLGVTASVAVCGGVERCWECGGVWGRVECVGLEEQTGSAGRFNKFYSQKIVYVNLDSASFGEMGI